MPVELEIELSHVAPADALALDREADRQRAERNGDLSAPVEVTVLPRSYVGGKPVFWHAELRVPAEWRFHFQLDGEEWWDGSPYALNFGGGPGYAFLSSDEREGRFYWDRVDPAQSALSASAL